MNTRFKPNTLYYGDCFNIIADGASFFYRGLTPIGQVLPSETQKAIWETLAPETQHIIPNELSKQTAESSQSSQVSNVLKTIEGSEFLNIKNMNLNQILRAVAQRRIQQSHTLGEAAESLDIDPRTLHKYTQWKESDE